MDFHLNVNDDETTHTQFDALLEEIKQHLAQWNNFHDPSQPQVIVVWKEPNNTPTIGISVGDKAHTADIFGGLPKDWTEAQKEWYVKNHKDLSN